MCKHKQEGTENASIELMKKMHAQMLETPWKNIFVLEFLLY
jgi:hypothetical protein